MSVAASALLGTSCGNDEATSTQDGAQAQRVRATVVAGFPPLPVRVAEVKGFFARNGLDVELTEGLDFAAQIAALDRQFDIAITSPSVFLAAAAQGVKIQAVSHLAAEDEEHPNQVLVAKDADIGSVADLEGKRIGVPVLTGTGAQSVLFLLEQAGLSPSDVKLIELGYPQMADQLKAGRVDAVVSAIPFYTVLGEQGFHVSDTSVVVDAVKAATDGTYGVGIGVFYAATERYAREHPDVVAKWRKSLQEADDWIAANEAEARAILQQWAKVPAAVAKTAPLPDFRVAITAQDLKPFVTIAETVGTQEQVSDVESLIWSGP